MTWLCTCLALAAPLSAQEIPSRDAVLRESAAGARALLPSVRDSAKRRPSNGPLQFRLGLLAWGVAEEDNVGNLARLKADAAGLGRVAIDALRLATAAAPDSARYWLAYIRLSTAMELPLYGQTWRVAVAAARASSDSAVRAETLMEAGRNHWRVYDGYAHRALRLSSDPSRSVSEAMNPLGRAAEDLKAGSAVDEKTAAALAQKVAGGQLPASLADMLITPRQDLEEGDLHMRASMREARQFLDKELQALPHGESGEGPYLQAEQLFREAYAAQPGRPSTFRQLAMLLAERSRWGELLALAGRQTVSAPRDAMGWLALGLAAHRLDQHAVAEAAFDSAFAQMDPFERTRLDRVDRVLATETRRLLHGMDSVSRARMTNVLWAAADPLWSRRGGEPRTEFLARVAFAELRWTVEDLRVNGADSDRGDAYIRWGPPKEMLAVGPPPGDMGGVGYLVTTFWWYDWGLLLAFEGPPRLSVARVAFGDDLYVQEMRDAAPVRWNNIARETVETLPVQLARFRAGSDSIDVVVAAAIPVDTISASTDVTGPVRADFWLVGGEQSELRDSLPRVAAGAGTVVSFRSRVLRRDYLYRVEATADGSLHAGQATGVLVVEGEGGILRAGRGMSDVLLASSVGGVADPRRWSELVITPIAGSVARGGTLALVWENYDLAARDGSVQYTIDVTIAPERRGAGRVALRAIDAIGRALGVVDDEGAGRVVFDRTRPPAAILPEYVSIGLEGTPPGRYQLTLRITDKSDGLVMERRASFEIR